ncbi:Ku protein [Rhizobium sp. OAE497]
MAPRRPYWRGYLKLSLVTCPVVMTPATSESEKVRFHTLNKDTGNRVVSHYVDSVTGKPVKDEQEAKGYERGENDYVLLTDEDRTWRPSSWRRSARSISRNSFRAEASNGFTWKRRFI